MPRAREYQHPGKHYYEFMRDAQKELDSATNNATYTTVQSVFIVFRRRLSLEDGIAFAAALPPVLGALFIKNWDTSSPKKEFGSIKEMNAEVKKIEVPIISRRTIPLR